MVLDTTVLVFAVGAEHPFREPCRQLISAAEDGSVELRTTVEVLQEFIHVRAHRRDREDAVALGRSYLTLLAPMLSTEETHLRAALAIYRGTPRIGMFDAVLASVALDNGATLISADVGFSTVSGLTHVVPTNAGVAGLLSVSDAGQPAR